jgi:NRPS condensation-like uncharacterized protein
MEDIPHRFPARLIDCFVDFLSPFEDVMIQLEMEFAGHLDPGRLAKAVDLTLDAEPVLGCRFVDSARKPCFERLDPDKRSAFFLASKEGEYETFKSSSIDHKDGSQIRVCLWQSPDGDRLLLKVAHQVADAGGVKDIAAVLSDIYRRLSNDPAHRPPPNIQGSRSLRQVLRHVPWHAYPCIYLNSLQSGMRVSRPHTVHTLSVPDGPREPLTYVTRLIPSGRVSTLAEYGRSHNATLNDVFAAASLRALISMGNWQGRSHVSLTTTIDMRRYVPSERAEAAANLSTALMRWPDLGTEPGQDLETTLDKVAKITRFGKTHWIGLDLLFATTTPPFKTMPHKWGMRQFQRLVKAGLKRQQSEHGFTNTGPIDPERVTFGVPPSMARILPTSAYPPMPFAWSLSGYNGTLTLAAGAYPTQKETIGKLFDAILKELPA